jgi:GNAT superfamily N-acetyltransferase
MSPPTPEVGGYEVSLDASRVSVDVVHDFLRTSYWSPGIRRDVVERAIGASLVAGAYSLPGGEQVGFARVVTDRATFAWLCDVFVLEAHRRRGLAQRMVRALLGVDDLKTLRRWALATRDAHAVYAALGFVPVDASRWMELRPPASGWQSPDDPVR